MNDIFTKEEVQEIAKTIRWLRWVQLQEYKDAVKSMINERKAASRPDSSVKRLDAQAGRSEQEALDIDSWKKKLSEFAPKPNLWADPMILQKQYLDSQKLKQTQDFQKWQRFWANAIWANRPTNISPKNSYDAVSPLKKNTVWEYSMWWPNGETVRQNSKWQHYYINESGNAVIVAWQPKLDWTGPNWPLQQRLQNM